MKKWKWQASLRLRFHVDVGFYVIAFPWMQESTTSVWFERALGSDRHRASQTAAFNSLTVYAAKALRRARLGRLVSAESPWK